MFWNGFLGVQEDRSPRFERKKLPGIKTSFEDLIHKVSELDGKFIVKVTDFGMSRVVQEYYNASSKSVPIRW